jgi:hypothetical protein
MRKTRKSLKGKEKLLDFSSVIEESFNFILEELSVEVAVEEHRNFKMAHSICPVCKTK